MKEPKREDFGWEAPYPGLGQEGGWTVEGGEEAYEAAMQSYLEQRRERAATAHFKVDIDGMRQNLLTSYNDLVKLLKANVSPLNDVAVDGYELEDRLMELHNAIVILHAISFDDNPAPVSSPDFCIEKFDMQAMYEE